MVLLGTALAVLLALLIGFLLARSYTRPLVGMTAAARAVAAGDYNHPIRVDRKDEIGALAGALNAMTVQLKSQIDTITADRNVTFAILASMVEGVVAVDRDDVVVHVNSAAEAILGIDATSAQGRRIWEVTRVVEVSEALNDAMKEGRVRVSEARITKAQKDQVIQVIGSPLKNANGERVGAVVVLHDVSDLRQLEGVRRDFVANISHELKTPLAAIRGLVETLIDDQDMDPVTHQRFIEKIHDQSMRLSNLVSDLLTLSRLESDQGGIQFEGVDVREAVAESYRAQVHVAESKKVEHRGARGRQPDRGRGRPRGAARVGRQSLEQRDQVHARRRTRRSAPGGGRPERGLDGRRHRHRHCPRGPGAHLRALLPRGQGAIAPVGRDRVGSIDREARRTRARRECFLAECSRPRQHVPSPDPAASGRVGDGVGRRGEWHARFRKPEVDVVWHLH